jgi:hypothetical protein
VRNIAGMVPPFLRGETIQSSQTLNDRARIRA